MVLTCTFWKQTTPVTAFVPFFLACSRFQSISQSSETLILQFNITEISIRSPGKFSLIKMLCFTTAARSLMTDDRTVWFNVKQLTSRPQQHNAKSTKPCTYTRIKHHWKVLRRIQVRWQEWAADSFSWFVSIYHLLIGVNTERKRRSESAAKDRQSGSSCHGHCKCPFTEHLTQDCSQQVGVSPRPRGHSQPSSFVIPLSFYLSVSQPHAQIFAWSSVTSSAFLSTRLRPVKDPHEEEREGRGAPIGPTAHLSIHVFWSDPHLDGHQIIFRKMSTIALFNNMLFWPSIKFW